MNVTLNRVYSNWYMQIEVLIKKHIIGKMSTKQIQMYQLVQKTILTVHQQQQLIQYISSVFQKSLFSPLPYQQMLKHLKPIQWSTQTKIFQQNDKIDHYYFLLQGSVNVYKQTVQNNQKLLQIVGNKIGPTKLGENVFNHNGQRTNTIIANQLSKGFIISKMILDQFCGQLVKEYKYLKSYISQFLNISTQKFYKLDLDQNLTIKTSTYGQKIDIQDSIFIIYSGECLMSFQYKSSQDCQYHSNPFKIKGHNKKFKPLLKLCNNQCFGMEKINQPQYKLINQDQNNKIRFKYKVSSDKLVYIAIPITKIGKFPGELSVKIRQIHNLHMNKLKENVYFKQSIQDGSKTSLLKPRSLSPPLKKRNSPMQEKFLKQKTQPIQRPKFIQVRHQIEPHSPSPIIKLPHLNPLKLLKSPSQKLGSTRIYQKQNHSSHLINKFYQKNQKNQKNQRNQRNTLNDVDIQKLKKNYCIGYDVRKMGPEEIHHFRQKITDKNHNQQPVGYFPIPNRRKILKQNAEKSLSIHENNKRRQWVHYLKLPKLLPTQNQ